MGAAGWAAAAVTIVSLVFGLIGIARASQRSHRIGELEAENESLRKRLRWFERAQRKGTLPPLTGPESVAVLRRLSDDPDAA